MSSQRSWQGYRCSGCLLIFVLLALPLSATTYYVDCNGANSNNGTSMSTPWQTIAKVNNSSFSPGDSVLFQKTCTWRETLTVPSSGSTENVITFGSYGSGANPIIDGSIVASSWTSAPVAIPNVWSISLATQPNQVFLASTRATQAASVIALTQHQWFWSSTTLYFYESAGNPDTVGDVILASQRNNCIDLNGNNYVTVQSIQCQYANQQGIYFSGASNTIVLDGVTSTKNYLNGVRSITSQVAQNITVQNGTFSWNGGSGISIGKSSHDWLVQRNTVNNNSQYDMSPVADQDFSSGIHAWCDDNSVTNLTIQYNDVYSNGVFPDGSRVTNGGSGAVGLGIWLDTIRASNYTSGSIVRYNRVHDNTIIGINLEHAAFNQVYNNVEYGTVNGYGIMAGDYSHVSGGVHDNKIFNNTVYNNDNGDIHVMGSSGSDPNDCYNNLVENNIVLMGSGGPSLIAEKGGENDGTMGSGNVYIYNGFGPPTTGFIYWGTGVSKNTYAAFDSAYGSSTHSVSGDPLFTNAGGGNFTLQSSSPAIAAGTNLGSTYQMSLDPRTSFPWGTLNQDSQGSGWEIGAFAFVQQIPLAPPTSLSATVK